MHASAARRIPRNFLPINTQFVLQPEISESASSEFKEWNQFPVSEGVKAEQIVGTLSS